MHEHVRIIPLGGLGEIGINMMAYEYGNDIIVVDMGIGFPGGVLPGVQYLLPNPTWLEHNKHRIRGVIITHGHMDHIGGIPYILPRIGFPPIYSLRLTIGLIKRRLEEFDDTKNARCIEISPEDTLPLGKFNIRFFRVNHSIPDGVGLSIQTPVGQIIHTGDWKLDHTSGDKYPAELNKLARFGGDDVLALLSDSTNSRIPGYSISEATLGNSIQKIFDDAEGRIIFTCNALILTRIQQVFNAAARHNRKVLILGRSMQNNIEVAINLGYLQVAPNTIIKQEQIKKFPDKLLTILTTGGQGEELAQLPRMARGEHRVIRLKRGDTAVVSANPIPGNEKPMQDMIIALHRLGVHVVYSKMLDIHASGHARQDELKLMLGLVRPKYFIPIHGERHMLVAHGTIAKNIGMSPENIFILDNGNILELTENAAHVLEECVPSEYLFVNDSGAGAVPVETQVERKQMHTDGMITIIIPYDKKRKTFAPPEIISRGFIYIKNNGDILREVGHEIRKFCEIHTRSKAHIDSQKLKQQIIEDLGLYLFQKTERRPLIVPVITVVSS